MNTQNLSIRSNDSQPNSLTRRTFIKGAVMSSTMAGVGFNPTQLLASTPGGIQNQSHVQNTKVLSGTEFHLDIGTSIVNFTGTPQLATTINNMLPSPTLIWREGDEVTLHVTNHLDEMTSIHWHGIILPFEMDGVPGLTFDGIKPGETFTYKFKVQQHGSYWYHSHSGFQEQNGMYGSIVILPKQKDPYHYQHDHVIQLSDWTDEDPHDVVKNLKRMPDYYNYQQRTLGDFFSEVQENGFMTAFNNRKMWNEMSMMDRDLSDVTGATYTYLMNGANPSTHWRGVFKPGEKVRLRFINSSAMTFFDIHIPGLKMTVIASDGNLVQPVEVDQLRIGVAETYDVLVEPQHEQAYAVFAQALDRSGYAIGSLTTDANLIADTPELDPLPILGHSDMAMDMSKMDHSMPGMHHDMHDMKVMPSMEHSQHQEMNHDTPDMSAMDHSQHQEMNHDTPDMSAMDHSQHQEMNQNTPDMSAMDHSQHQSMNHAMEHDTPALKQRLQPNANLEVADWPVEQAKIKWGPHTNMRAEDAQYRLSDPGVGLRNNGRKVLTYADLRNLYPTNLEPKPDREIVLNLTGNMERYMWSIDGVPYSKAEPMHFKFGERIRITFINNTMMNHPMHLHGMWSDLETGDLNYLPRKHTIVVQPGARISYRVTVDAKGVWAYHCHMLYHMAGMFRKVIVA
ncbi:copper resistance protein [Thiomicrorhabdus immobilis]|uniref:Copper resistance protein n=1 Tax=Thiomicrorhabdus immobilis TaxID=2791037 RepID=A0ABM7MAE5_9GAMM|nr:copper resistance system multicopper oxidase [Thiomicrorhabdus immobilis]BCN92303.1 copper resistance protein [Thiomicrorhabdus immobilis]